MKIDAIKLWIQLAFIFEQRWIMNETCTWVIDSRIICTKNLYFLFIFYHNCFFLVFYYCIDKKALNLPITMNNWIIEKILMKERLGYQVLSEEFFEISTCWRNCGNLEKYFMKLSNFCCPPDHSPQEGRQWWWWCRRWWWWWWSWSQQHWPGTSHTRTRKTCGKVCIQEVIAFLKIRPYLNNDQHHRGLSWCFFLAAFEVVFQSWAVVQCIKCIYCCINIFLINGSISSF